MAYLTRVSPEIPVTDLEASIAFYDKKLGFDLAMKMPSGDYAIVERDDVALHLFVGGTPARPPVSVHIFTIGLNELFTEIEGRGAKILQRIVSKPGGTRDFRIADPSGNVLKFTEPMDEAEDE